MRAWLGCPLVALERVPAGAALAFLVLAAALVPRPAQAARPPSAEAMLVYFGTYTGPSSKGIYVSRFDPRTGQLSPPELAAATPRPSFLALHSSGRYLYAVNEIDHFGGERSGAASAFAIDASTGRLRPLGQVSTRGADPCHLSADRQGRHLFVANYGGGNVAVLPIRADGSLGAATSLVQHEGHGPNVDRQRAPHVHQTTLGPTGDLLWAADLGIDEVLAYRFDAARGALVTPAAAVAAVAPGSGPRHFAFAKGGSHLFVLGELALTVTSFHLDAVSGAAAPVQTISTLPEGVVPSAGFLAAAIEVHDSGRFLYASTRGSDTITVFSVDGTTGLLRRVEVVSSGGKTPRAFAVDPTGRYLVAANQGSNEVAVFRIDPATGRLSRTAARAQVGSPVSVLFVQAPRSE